MTKRKQLMIGLAALTSALLPYSVSADTTLSPKYEKLYNFMTKNIDKGISDNSGIKTLEKILKQRNKELNDLYLQGDYIVKPEYLEWQVFATGFYTEYGKGRDNTPENAKYYSDVTGYFDANGNYIVTSSRKNGISAKSFQPLQLAKDIDLGVNIPLKQVNKDPIVLNLTPTPEINIVPNTITPSLIVPTINSNIQTFTFEISEPQITLPNFILPKTFTVAVPDTGNGDDTGSYLGTTGSYTAKIGQYNLTSGELIGTWDANSNLSAYEVINLNGTPDSAGNTMGTRPTYTNYNYSSATGDGAVALYKLGGTPKVELGTSTGSVSDFTMKIISNVAPAYTGFLPHLIQYDPHGSRGIAAYTAYTTDYYGSPIASGSTSVFDYYGGLVNYGTLIGEGNNLLIIGMQQHTGSFSPTVKNYGLIQGVAGGTKQVAFSFMAPQNINGGRRFEFYNMPTGKIIMNSPQSIAFNFGASPALTTIPHMTVFNNGEVTLNGDESVGVKTAGTIDYTYSKLVLNTPIVMNGNRSIGVELTKLMDDGYGNVGSGYDPRRAAIKVLIGDTKNSSNTNVENSIGFYINKNTLDFRLSDYNLKFGDYAINSALINLASGELYIDNDIVQTFSIDNGSKNFGIIVDGASSKLTFTPNIKIGTTTKSVDETVALYAKNNSRIILDKTNYSVDINGNKSHAIMLESGATLQDNALLNQIDFTSLGDNSTFLQAYLGATIDLSNTNTINMDLQGDKSIGVYNKGGIIKLGNSGTYKINTNGVLFYNDNSLGTGSIEVGGDTFTIGDSSVFTRLKDSSGTPGNEQIKFTNTNSTLNLLSGGIGFIYTGDGVTPVTTSLINSYFTNNFSGLNNMDVNISSGGRLYIIENYANINLSSISSIGGSSGVFKTVTNNGGSKAFILKGILNLDPASGVIDLDNPLEDFNSIERALTGITVNSGVTLVSNNNGIAALADDNSYEAIQYVHMTNNGTIDLLGSQSVGIYTNRGTINNNNIINTIGQNSIGLFGENDTITKNNSSGIINIGTNGIGIYGISYQNPSVLPLPKYGSGQIDITNSGLIQSTTSTEAIGIYANNNKIMGSRADAVVNLSTGTIDVSNSNQGVGIYVNKGTLTDTAGTGSIITVGKDGLAIYAKDSDINLAGSTVINLNGDNATGVYLDSTSTVNPAANLTFNIDGKNIVLFNLNFSAPTKINAGFTVNSVTPGSSYLGGNLTNAHINYAGNAILNSDSVLFNGVTSEILVDSGASITATSGSTNVAGLLLDGFATGIPASGWLGDPNFNGENRGTITVGDQSIGIFGKNEARILNAQGGTITVGDQSVALKSSSTNPTLNNGRVYNRGTINIGYKSQGMYLKYGNVSPTQPDLYNESTGKIISSSAEAVGMFADDVDITQNDGLINLSGDQSVGIYIVGTNLEDTINNGDIIMGNSSNVNAPSIGIYSTTAGEIITNNGNISVGSKSIGIYADNSPINHNGSLSIGDKGIGVYSTGGTVDLNAGSSLNFGTSDVVGIYGVGSTINNNTNHTLGNNNYGFILEGGTFNNSPGTTSTLGTNSVFLYSTQASNIINDGNIILSGDDNIAFYTAAYPGTGVGGANILNIGNITGTTGKNNIGIYNYGGTVTNTGNISVGDSGLILLTQSNGDVVVDVANSKYAVGIYGENSTIINSNNISAGYGGVGIVANKGSAINTSTGTITTNGDYSMGMYTEEGVITNDGTITVIGNNAIGMAGKGVGSQLINNGTINVTGTDAIAMYGNYDTVITNAGTINISGTGASAFVSPNALDPRHQIGGFVGTQAANNSYIHQSGGIHELPTLINAGIIKTTGVLALDGIQVLIKPNPGTITASTDPDYDFELSGTSIIADHITTSVPIVILPGFADGTIADVYKLSGLIQASSGKYDFLSGSLLWEATPDQTSTGADIYMSRKSFDSFSSGLWFDDFGKALDAEFLNARGNAKATEIYNNTAYITNESDFRHVMASLAGNVYANINQREKDITDTFENSLHILQNSTNNTKENVKISVIGGKGKNKEETDGVVGYDYTTTGVLALREVERTYKHTFGYSLGYLHTGFEFKDGNESEEWVDTIQLGVHNKYKTNGWELRNNLTGQASIHNIDRNLDWPSPVGRSEMDGHYETYSITSDNILGKEFNLGKNASVMPYGGVKAMYVTRPSFEEKGLEALKVEGNDAWSVKPKAGVELNTSIPIGSTAWKLKGMLDLSYNYELANLNEREKAKLINVEEGYHKLSKPEKEKGTFITKASVGVEVTDRYGVYLTGEYSVGEHKEDDYRAGVNLKAVF